ncbi:MAG: thiamine phosphate synthase [Syntrophomonadaceae bacterium]|nr:thiamine phosphate synthase [Syntrophomonadaceae bacterium]
MVIYVTNRKLCEDDFLGRINQLAQGKPHAVILREKDLSLAEYESLAFKVREICGLHEIPLIINQNITAAARLKLASIHLSMPDLRSNINAAGRFIIGVSVHSAAEAREAQALGAAYLIAGHIYATACKEGIAPRGLPFLKEVCASVRIPVYAIGGITRDRANEVLQAGAHGICIMSEAMTCADPADLAGSFRAITARDQCRRQNKLSMQCNDTGK